MNYTTLASPVHTFSEEDLIRQEGVNALYETLRCLPDPRRGQGKRYELRLLLCLLILAKLAGQKTLCGATEWIRHRREAIAEHIGLKRTAMPCQMTSC